MKKRVVLLLLLAQTFQFLLADNYDFYVKSNSVNIYYKVTDSSMSNRMVEVVPCFTDPYPRAMEIPSTITYNGKKYKVTGIGERAFQNCTGVTSIKIPNSITYILNQAFWNTGITTLDIPESVTHIGKSAFAHNATLETVNFPNSIIEVEGEPFAFCENIKHSIFNENIYVKYVGQDSKLVIPEGTKVLCENATSESFDLVTETTIASKVTDIVLPESIETLAYAAIYSSNLRTITIKALTPPNCDAKSIVPITLAETITVYVSNADPAIIERYKTDPYWSQFNIVATDLSDDDPKNRADVNGDSVINAADVVSIYNYIISGEESSITKDRADVNGDNDVNAADVVSVYNYITTGEQ